MTVTTADASALVTPRKALVWTGRVFSGVLIAFMAFDIVIKLINLPIVDQTGRQLGMPAGQGQAIGVLELAILVLYVVPRTAVLGAVLLTGLFGGAVAIHLRVGDPWLSHTLFGVYLGLFAWGGLYLRDPRLRAIFPIQH